MQLFGLSAVPDVPKLCFGGFLWDAELIAKKCYTGMLCRYQ